MMWRRCLSCSSCISRVSDPSCPSAMAPTLTPEAETGSRVPKSLWDQFDVVLDGAFMKPGMANFARYRRLGSVVSCS